MTTYTVDELRKAKKITYQERVKNMEFKTAYQESCSEMKIDCSEDEPLTEQSHKEACDVNNLVRQHLQMHGYLPDVSIDMENIIDVSEIGDFQATQNSIAHINSVFETFPAKIRNEFENSAAKFIEFSSNPENAQKMVDLGFKPYSEFVESKKVDVETTKKESKGKGEKEKENQQE